jgi:hypothetical protein
MHSFVGLHDTVGSVRPRRDEKAVQYTFSYISKTRRPYGATLYLSSVWHVLAFMTAQAKAEAQLSSGHVMVSLIVVTCAVSV